MTVLSYDNAVIKEVCNLPFQTFYNLPEDKRKLIIEASLDEFYDYGYQKANISRIVEKTNIARGSFYQYFKDKQDLYRYIIIEVIGNLKHSYANNELKDIETMQFANIIRELFMSGIKFYCDYPKMANIAVDFTRIRDLKLKSEILGYSSSKNSDFFINLIEERKKKGEINKAIDSKVLSHLITTLSISFSDYFVEESSQDFHDHKLIDIVDNMIFIIKNGLASE